MVLAQGKAQETLTVQQIDLPLHLQKRLEALGLTQGSQIFVIKNKNEGTMVIQVRGTRFAIGKGISQNVKVEAA